MNGVTRKVEVVWLLRDEDPVEKVFDVFRGRLTLEEFRGRLDALGYWKKWRFVRSCLMFQQALTCKDCEPNVAMMLLCSSAEVIRVDREGGSHYNFKKFYLDYCPQELRVPPVQYYPLTPPLTLNDASFEDALDYIYSKFRCYFVHRGIRRLELPPEDITLVGDQLMDKFKDKAFVIERINLLGWMTNITRESLFKVL